MKTALVTGGSRGIGSAIALGLGKNFHVVVGYANSEDKANDVVQEIVAAGGSASTVQIDISNAESVDTAFSTVEKEYNSVDVLINNAGITQDNILPRMKEAEWLEVIQTNLTGSFYTSQRAIKLMMKNKENIIEQLSIKRIGKPEDISNVVSFLCSEESEYITGQVIPVDGGLTT